MQELAAIEGLARADIVCTDTGTITEPSSRADIHALDGADAHEAEAALGRWRPATPSRTPACGARRALRSRAGRRAVMPRPPGASGTGFGVHGDWVLGAPNVLLDAVGATASAAMATRPPTRATQPGGSAGGPGDPPGPPLLLARTRGEPSGDGPPAGGPWRCGDRGAHPRERPLDARLLAAGRHGQGRVGDDPRTEPPSPGWGSPTPSRPATAELPDDPEELADVMETTGRLRPCGASRSRRWCGRCRRGATRSP